LEDPIVDLGDPKARLEELEHRRDGLDRPQLREQIDGVEGGPPADGTPRGIPPFPLGGGSPS
jgi:hypothetical protein